MIRLHSRTGLLLAGLAFAGAAVAQETKPESRPPARPRAVEQALAKAQKHHRRVLLTVLGGDGDSSKALMKAQKGRELSHLLLYEFEQAQLHPLDDAEGSRDFVARQGLPLDASALPALAVLDVDGKQLLRLEAKDLFADDAVQVQRIVDALQKAVVEPLDADAVLASALADAKKADKRLLLTFDAPW